MKKINRIIIRSGVLAEKNDVQHVGVTLMLRIDIDANAKLIHAPRC